MKLKYKAIIMMIFIISIQFIFFKNVNVAATGMITEITVNVRQEPSTESKLITRVTQDDEVEVIEKAGAWYKIKTKNKTGYVYGEYIKVDDSKISEEDIKQDNDEVIPEIEKSFYISEDAKLSIVPNIASNIIYTAKKDIPVEKIEDINGWSYIKVENFYGWIRIDYLKEQDHKESSKENKEELQKEENQETKNSIKYTKYDKVNLRQEPSIDSKTLQKLSLNTEVTVIEEVDSKWSKVKVGDKSGYISSELLANEKQDSKEEKTDNKSTSRNAEEDRKEESENIQKIDTSLTENAEKETTATIKEEEKITGEDVVNYAKKYLGYKYVYGGTSPSKGFDCSGFTYYVYKHFGYTLSRSSSGQASNGTEVKKEDLKPGDLVIYKNTSLTKIGHVGIYIGDNKMIHASEPGVGVIITDINSKSHKYPQRFVMGRRILK